MVVEKGHTVAIEYTGKLEDGQIFDTSEGREPLKFEVGSGMVIPGFDKGVLGMEEGQEKVIEIEPVDAYGELRGDLLREIPKDSLQFEEDPQVGMGLMLGTPDGRQIQAKVAKVDENNITLDLNHPLAGKKLIFEVKLVGLEN